MGHSKEDQLTALQVTADNNYLISGDTAGRIKLWDIREVDFRSHEDPMLKMRDLWFIQAHRDTINTIHIVDNLYDKKTKLPLMIVSASEDKNILLHRLEDGIKIG